MPAWRRCSSTPEPVCVTAPLLPFPPVTAPLPPFPPVTASEARQSMHGPPQPLGLRDDEHGSPQPLGLRDDEHGPPQPLGLRDDESDTMAKRFMERLQAVASHGGLPTDMDCRVAGAPQWDDRQARWRSSRRATDTGARSAACVLISLSRRHRRSIAGAFCPRQCARSSCLDSSPRVIWLAIE